MNQKKIGKFITENRKKKNLTGEQLAEILGVTPRTIINWENGKCMPDYSLLVPLCNELDITVDELIYAKYEEESNDTLELILEYLDRNRKVNLKQKQKLGKIFLIGGISVTMFITTFIPSNFFQMYGPDPNLYLTLSIILSIIGFSLINNKYKIKKRMLLNIIFIITFFSFLIIQDTVYIIIKNQPPRFSTSGLYSAGYSEVHQTLFYNVYRCYNQDDKYHITKKNKEADFTKEEYIDTTYYYCNEEVQSIEW